MFLPNFVKYIFPEKFHPKIREIYFRSRSLLYRGERFACPCCAGYFRKFLPFGNPLRHNAMCPRCRSLERHRLLYLYLRNRTNLFSQELRVLHFAPEYIFQKTFGSMPNLDYVSADLYSQYAEVKVDIMKIPYENNSFDVILCSHVLEHVLDDRKAMREMSRVLRPHGWGILQVPIDLTREKTFEDRHIISPEERERVFGQSDHIRIYGRDYKNRLESAGFTVKVDSYVGELSSDMIQRYHLKDDEDIYFCLKVH